MFDTSMNEALDKRPIVGHVTLWHLLWLKNKDSSSAQ